MFVFNVVVVEGGEGFLYFGSDVEGVVDEADLVVCVEVVEQVIFVRAFVFVDDFASLVTVE